MKRHIWWMLIALAAAGAVLIAAGRTAAPTAKSATGTDQAAPTEAPETAAAKTVSVSLTPATKRTFEKRIVLQGNVEAKACADVAARVTGTIETMFVDEGDPVIAGETKLFQIDSVKLQKALDIAQQDLAVAECALREKEANQESVEVDLKKAEIDLKRFKQLYDEGTISVDSLEKQQAHADQMRATLKHAKSLVDLAREQERQAELSVGIAKKDLSDSLVVAPINGVVSQTYHKAGENGESGKSVLRIDDPSLVEVAALLPASVYPEIHPGATKMRVRVAGIDAGERPIAYRSPTIHPKLRTFEVKCVIQNPPDGVVPGALADVEIVLEQREGVGVPRDAVLQRADRDVVFTVAGKKARQVRVATGLETDGFVELTGANLKPGTPVVTSGQYLLNDGAPVAVREATQ